MTGRFPPFTYISWYAVDENVSRERNGIGGADASRTNTILVDGRVGAGASGKNAIVSRHRDAGADALGRKRDPSLRGYLYLTILQMRAFSAVGVIGLLWRNGG